MLTVGVVALQDYEASTFDDSDQSDPEQEGQDRGNVDTPTEPYRTNSPEAIYRPQRDSMMSFMTTSTRTAVNSITPYGPSYEIGVNLRQDSADSLIIVPGDVEAESGVVEEGCSGVELNQKSASWASGCREGVGGGLEFAVGAWRESRGGAGDVGAAGAIHGEAVDAGGLAFIEKLARMTADNMDRYRA